ncbi:MAG: TrkH family potassium uptake protein [Candidatus Cyclobacteriaceae bacterium M2_1C_046]
MLSVHKRAFLKDLGAFLHIPGFLSLSTFVVIIFFEEWYALIPFGILTIISFGLGQLFYRAFYTYEETVPGSSYALISLVWMLLPFLGTIPFYGVSLLIPEADISPQMAIFANFHNSFFESMSGFTGTGLTMLDDPSMIPHSIQWWRSITEWVGGLGIIFLAVVILDTAHSSESLYQSEAMGWKSEYDDPKKKIIKILWIYIAYTFLSVTVFFLVGMPLWESINHGITGISTGGFSITKDSFTGYDERIKWAAVPIILLGSFSFKIHVLLVNRNFKRLLEQTQLRYFVIFFILIITLSFIANSEASAVDVFFQTTSALGTCGFNSVALSEWPALFLFPLLIAMFLGGNSSSTTGGLKTQRIAWLIKIMKENVRQAITPDKEEFRFKLTYNGKQIENEEAFLKIRLAAILLFVWIIILTAGTFMLSHILYGQYNFYEILFEVNSALNNVGLSSGVTGHQLPTSAKWILSMVMWVGRLEIMGVIVMFTIFIGRGKKQIKQV